jgi:hypothetical protein
MKTKFFVLYCLFVLFSFIGCSKSDGPRTEYVEGNVTFNGQSLSKALVVFYPVNDSGIAASGTTNEHGIFRLTSLRGGAKDAGAIANTAIIFRIYSFYHYLSRYLKFFL